MGRAGNPLPSLRASSHVTWLYHALEGRPRSWRSAMRDVVKYFGVAVLGLAVGFLLALILPRRAPR